MKTRIGVVLIFAIATAGSLVPLAFPRRAAAKEKETPASHACVILQGYQTFERDSTGYRYSGIGVYCSSSSSNAPIFTPPTFNNEGGGTLAVPMAEAVAELLSQGFHIERAEAMGFVMVR